MEGYGWSAADLDEAWSSDPLNEGKKDAAASKGPPSGKQQPSAATIKGGVPQHTQQRKKRKLEALKQVAAEADDARMTWGDSGYDPTLGLAQKLDTAMTAITQLAAAGGHNSLRRQDLTQDREPQ